MAGVLLIVKSGVSNHTAFDIPDDPCLSKFGALRRMSPHAADNFRAFARFYIVCEAAALAPLGRSLIVCGVSDTAGGVFKRGKDTE